VAKYGIAGQTTENVKRRMRFACWITKATNTPSEYVILLFHCKSGHANAPQCYVIRTLYVLLNCSLGILKSQDSVIGKMDNRGAMLPSLARPRVLCLLQGPDWLLWLSQPPVQYVMGADFPEEKRLE
jgi:hypothetical protein